MQVSLLLLKKWLHWIINQIIYMLLLEIYKINLTKKRIIVLIDKRFQI